ncbi:s-methyl-5-thioribose-1-phosphate isomerase [Pseudonocardia sp. MH-G8]|uniref:s-methyl-5-thioribose-1-phosphate isomerase n=1 Tax=Pseudonocardia sp. MH-G8 TaxID=1854588 RepID=UPI000BA166BC|nr:s-methyl-5-thioribose-1-phosphate isomerase [Pseudonocardia sp. MH-G8]OZM76062.1 methylthioribose-1-phosphate isomerase [Pseudonocardia sp. MH-G8]
MTPTGTDPVAVPTLISQNVLVDDDAVHILDRRVFPFERKWVTCRDHEDVARAIEEMVTQSSGPFFAAAAGMTLAARAADRLATTGERREFMVAAGHRLMATRRTNNQIRDVVTALLEVAENAVAAGEALAPVTERSARDAGDRYLARSRALGEHAATLIPDGATLLTHCWAESYLTETVAAVVASGKRIDAICTETRPYLQGARLTAESLAEMGVPTRLITDGMAAHLMSRGDVSVFVTAADRVTMDGHVVNKIGTLQIAVSAHAFDVPYVALVQAPDRQAPDAASVELEDRDGDEVLHCLGRRTASTKVTGLYPAFDITPPRFVSAVVTDRGRFSPHDMASYHRDSDEVQR